MDTPSAAAVRACALRQCLGLTFLAMIRSAVAGLHVAETAESKLHLPPSSPSEPRMNPTHEVYRGADVVWQIPPHPKAVLFLAEGTGSSALIFFDKRPSCQRCYGRPEDRQVVLDALDRGYAVIALSSIGYSWVALPLDTSPDLDIATNLIHSWTRAHSLEHLPLFAWGHSAGGVFVASLSFKIPLRGVVLMCSHPLLGLLETETVSPDQFPPIFFAHMARDVGNVARIEKWMSILSAGGVSVAEKRFFPKQVTPHFFAQRIVCISNETSEKIYSAYNAEGWLDSAGYLTKNPSEFAWDFPLRKWEVQENCCNFETGCLGLDVFQELNVAFGWHSFTSDADDEIFSWFEMRLSTKPTVLAEV